MAADRVMERVVKSFFIGFPFSGAKKEHTN